MINPIHTYKIPNLIDNHLYSTIQSISLLETFSVILLSTFLFVICLSLISYALSIFTVGHTISFIIFKKLTDDDDLLKRLNKDELKKEEDYFNFNKEKIKSNKNRKI